MTVDVNNSSWVEETKNKAEKSDTRLRILYLYQLLLKQSDETHPLSTKQIIDKMEEMHGIHMHRTTVPSDICCGQAFL